MSLARLAWVSLALGHGARGGVIGVFARAMIRGRSLNSRRRMIQAMSPATIKSGIQSIQSTAQRMKAFPETVARIPGYRIMPPSPCAES
ncbi:MAG: hypothetical protein ACXVBB_14600, partial [Isosphaeraceae bacterium]